MVRPGGTFYILPCTGVAPGCWRPGGQGSRQWARRDGRRRWSAGNITSTVQPAA